MAGGLAGMFGDPNQRVSTGLDNGLKGGIVSQAGPKQPAIPKMQGGGVGGFLYNNLIQPFANGTTNVGADLAGLIGGAGTAVKDVAQGKRGDKMVNAYFNSTPVGQAYSEGKASGGTGKGLEQAAGNLGSDVLNMAAPIAGPEEIAGKAGLKAALGAGAKLGAAYGGAGGVTSAMAQGETAGQVGSAGAAGLGLGALAGAATGAAGAGIGRLARGATTGTKAAGSKGSLISRAAQGVARTEGKVIKAKNSAEAGFLLPGAQQGIDKGTGIDKQGDPVSFNQVADFAHGVGMTPDTGGGQLSDNFQLIHDIGTQTIGNHLAKATEGIRADGSGAADVGRTAIARNSDLIGGSAKSGARVETLNQIRMATSGLNAKSTVPDILKTISYLEGKQADLHTAVKAGDSQAVGQNNVYQAVLDHLDGILNNSEVNKAIKGYQLDPTTDANAIGADVVSAGGSHDLATHLINSINDGKSYGELRSDMQIPVIAGKFARAAKLAEARAVPAMPAGMNSPAAASEVALSLAHPAYTVFAASKLPAVRSLGHNIERTVLSKLAPNAYKAGLERELAPAPETAAKINFGRDRSAGYSEPAPAPASAQAPSGNRPVLGGISGLSTHTPAPIGAGVGAGMATVGAAGAAPATPVASTPDATLGSQLPPDQGAQGGQGAQDSPYSQQAFLSDVQRDPKNASTYMSLYKMLNPTSTAGNIKPNSAQFGEASAGSQALQQMSQMIQSDPNVVAHTAVPGQNTPLLGSLVRRATGTGEYQTAADTVLNSLARMYTGANMPKSEEGFYRQMLPQPLDSAQTVQFKLQRLQNDFQPFMQVNGTDVSNGQ